MTRTTKSGLFLLLGLAAGLAACGVRDTPLASGDGGAAGEESAGAQPDGGVPGSGGTSVTGGAGGAFGATGGGTAAPACTDEAEPFSGSMILAACLSPVPRQYGQLTGVIEGLAVLERVAGDPAQCANGGNVPSGFYERATDPWVAWRLRDPAGETWLAQFAIGQVPDDLFSPGDIVTARYLWGTGSDGRGYFELERDESPGRPAVFLAYGSTVPSVTIERGPALCCMGAECVPEAAQQCTVNMTRITVDGETRDLGLEERAELGGIVIQNDWFQDWHCAIVHPPIQSKFLVGGYAPP